MTSVNEAIAQFERTGGPAFPSEYGLPEGGSLTSPGMTLRDHFAGLAMAAIVSKLDLHGRNSEACVPHKSVDLHERHVIMSEIASGAYGYADAMLAERSKP